MSATDMYQTLTDLRRAIVPEQRETHKVGTVTSATPLQVQWLGEDEDSGAEWQHADDYTPTVGDTVVGKPYGDTWIVEYSVNGGSSTPTAGTDTEPPAAPTGLSATASEYQGPANGETYGLAAVSWSAVTANADGSAIHDLAGYLVTWGYSDISGDSNTLPITKAHNVSINGLLPSKTINVSVVAVDTSGNVSGAGTTSVTIPNDTVAPPTPSNPTVANYLGIIQVGWNGLSSTGAAMPSDFDHAEVHVSTNPTFTPSSATLIDTMKWAGFRYYDNTTYGTTYFAKLIAVDKSGNKSGATASSIGATTAQVGGGDIAANSITTTHLAAGAVTAGNIAAGAVTADSITAGALDAISINAASLSAVTMSGHIIGSDISGSDFLVDSDQGRVLIYQQTPTVAISDTTAGINKTWTVPAGVTTLKLEGWGAGGAGSNGVTSAISGGGGGGGEYAAEPIISVNPGDTITYTVPAGGTAHTGDPAPAATIAINGVTVLTANGGVGPLSSGGSGGQGGTGSTNTIHFDGGMGGNRQGGGGGSSAGTKASGNAGTTGTYNGIYGSGAAAPANGGAGGNGGDGRTSTPTNGSPGSTPGGGGGAGNFHSATASSSNGGNGAAGKVQITYYATVLVASLASVAGTTDAYGNTIPVGLKVQRQDLTGVLGGYATERTYQFTSLASSSTYSFTSNGTIVEQLSDYGGPFTSGVFTAPVSAFYDANMFVTGASTSGVTIDRSTDGGTTWTTRFANTSPGSPQNVSCGGPLWLNSGDKVRFGARQNSGSTATISGNFFIGVRA